MAGLLYALVSDWKDAAEETTPSDAETLAAALDGIRRLNEVHGPAAGGRPRFHVFHRARRWNAGEGCWMGWERKRGKLHELNRLLRGAGDTSFLTLADAPEPPPDVRYVITLDADTRLPAGAARALVGLIAHPLNRAVLDPTARRVVAGYGVLQPRISPALPDDEGSIYERITTGPAGLDPYAAAVSDVYQDLFGEGSYAGKGIYDIDAFEGALGHRVPENALLSHDLFEGTFARSGLASEVTFFEEFPSHYAEAALRAHRWARGDWQLLPWIIGRRAAEVPALGRWKMVDNLRRTLLAPCTVLTLVAAWLLDPVPAATWTKFVVAILCVPPAIPVLTGLVPLRPGVSKRSHVRGVLSDAALALGQVGLSVVLLVHQATLMTDAIVRTLARLYATHRRLLEWVTAARAKARIGREAAKFHRGMLPALVLVGAIALGVVAVRPSSAAIAAPFVALWALAPLVARRVSTPIPSPTERPLLANDEWLFRLTARETWRFFETFVGPADNALPPDNFQEDPRPIVAHRTSPTNIGLYLLSTVTARDFGWLGLVDTVERLEAALSTLDRMERFRGHFYNWYDTQTLRPFEPPYVSSVDSGNLAGALLVVAQACDEFAAQPFVPGNAEAGLLDTLGLAIRSASTLPDDRRTTAVRRRQLDELTSAIERRLQRPHRPDWIGRLDDLRGLSRTLLDVVQTLHAEREDDTAVELLSWCHQLDAAVQSHVRDAELSAESSEWTAVGRRLGQLAVRARGLFEAMDFRFLLDPTRNLLFIGYRPREGEPDPNCYDLLASEARLASFLAIAKGDVPVSHWFQLGRPMTPVGRGSALVSWSGSMFEYLMPALFMRSPPASLLAETYRWVVRRQIGYGAGRHVPWGVSESAFYARDLQLTYQYSNFGVPGLGLDRGLSDDLVIAPYATALAAMIEPASAAKNLRRLAARGAQGRYGFYEALDYTPSRIPERSGVGMVRAYMAHHQGMSLVALGNVVHQGLTQARFHAAPLVRAADLLLQERAPRDVAVARPRAEELNVGPHVRAVVGPVPRRFTSAHDAVPRTHLLSNGRYASSTTRRT